MKTAVYVMEFGASPPTRGLGHLHDIARRTRNYQNDRVFAKRMAVRWDRDVASRFVPTIAPLEQEATNLTQLIEAKLEEIQRVPRAGRIGESVPKHLRETAPETAGLMVELKALKDARRGVFDKIRAEVSEFHVSLGSAEDNMLEDVAEATLLHVIQKLNAEGKPFPGKPAALELLAQLQESRSTGIWPKPPETQFAKKKPRKPRKARKEKDEMAKNKALFLQRCKQVLGPNVRGPEVVQPLKESLIAGLVPGEVSDPFKARLMVDVFEQTAGKMAYTRSGTTAGGRAVADAAHKAALQATSWPQFKDSAKPIRVGPTPFQTPVPVAKILSGACATVRVDIQGPVGRRRPRKGQTFDQPLEGATRQLAVATIRLDNTGRDVEIPFVLHRPFPSDAVVSHVYVKMERVGLQTRYKVQFTIRSEAKLYPESRDRVSGLPVASSKKPLVALNLGFRLHTEGGTRTWDGSMTAPGDLRVATAWDGEKSFEVCVGRNLYNAQDYQESIISNAGSQFEEARRVVMHELQELELTTDEALKLEGADLPHWVKMDSIAKWQSHGKLAVLAKTLLTAWSSRDRVLALWPAWKRERPKSSEYGSYYGSFEDISAWLATKGVTSRREVLALYLDWWRHKNEHLVQLARNHERKRTAHRKDLYRQVAAWLSASYENVVIEDWNKAETAQRKDNLTEITKAVNATSRQRQAVGVSVLTEALRHKFGDGLKTAPASGITMTHTCGGTAQSPAGPRIVLRCQACHTDYDQDLNAARQLWTRETFGGDTTQEAARTPIAAE